jgi:membrane protein
MSLKDAGSLLKTAAIAWYNDSAPRLGAALSYYTVFALSPLFIIIIFIGSLWLDQNTVRAALFEQLGGLVGEQGAQAMQTALKATFPQGQGLLASMIAMATLLLTATGLFIELQSDLNSIWGVEEKPGGSLMGFVRNRLLSFAIIVGTGFLLLVSLVISAALVAMGKYFSTRVPGWELAWQVVNGSVSFAVITALFAMIFKVLPDVRIAWRDVWVGAAVTALLFTVGKFLLGLYLGRNATVSAYGAAGSVVLILLWVYYSGQILFFGAELTQVYANRFGAGFEPKPYARWVEPPAENVKRRECAARAGASAALPPDPKVRLIAELREEVEKLRTRIKTYQSEAIGAKLGHANYRRKGGAADSPGAKGAGGAPHAGPGETGRV